LFLLIISLLSISSLVAEEWSAVKLKGKGSITVFYYNSDNFINDSSGKLTGIEYDLLINFKEYLKSRGVDLTLEFKRATDFSSLYKKIKYGSSGEFGACSFSITEERLKEVAFSPKYMPDIQVLINSKNIPIAKNEAEFIELFSPLTGVGVRNTTFEQDLLKLRSIVPNFKLEYENSSRIIRDRIMSTTNLFGYVELPTYLKLFENGLRFKRQNLYKVEREGYGIILPKNSSWIVPINDFFKSDKFKVDVNKIIKKHLGKGVKDLLWKIEESEGSESLGEISLLTMEREIQEMEIEQQDLKVQILIGGVVIVLIIAFLLLYSYRIKRAVSISLQERNKLIEKQKTELERLSIVAEKMSEAVIITDPTGKIEYYNESLIRNSGYDKDGFEAYFKDFEYLQQLTSQEGIDDVINGFKNDSQPFMYDSAHIRKDGSKMWTAASLSPVYDEKKQLSKIIIVYNDINERKGFSDRLKLQNQEITDSIIYAKMIQDAMLPSESILGNVFDDYCILFQPKDIVSGDFYWLEELGDFCVMVLADCTGHGVPGAFMSMMGSNFLTNIITDNSVRSTCEALKMLDDKVKKALKSEDYHSRDGMDIVFMAYNKNTKQLLFSGGNNSIFVMRNKTLIKYKGDRLSIGSDGIEDKEFMEQTIALEKGDVVYTFTDGYKDQFGGPKGKKFMEKKLLSLLVENSELPLMNQKSILKETIEKWMEGYEQIDDISLMAFKV
jgi:PAS domain S-box-containing protein